MKSPAQLHRERTLAKQAAEQSAVSGEEMQGTEYELNLAQLAQQKRALKEIKSQQTKNDVKKELLPEWQAYIDGTLAADAGVQDQIIGQLLIWSIDVADLDTAFALAEYMLRHNLSLPEHFKRETADAFAEEMADLWLNSKEPVIDAEQLMQVNDMTAGYDMHDEIRAKLHRAIGEACHASGDDASAIDALQNALNLNPKVGCKQLLDKLVKDAEKIAENKDENKDED